ncbi:hypothetical protein GSI_12415 [Ganoderma sinense ZZ0214-1]|uniref:Fungal-type protein kinase domain-containing protein n=1 Tax=Ganoderma sinense ZZ0214-1 TaxID=1077348 RepID=A0A2G8RW18_9APHY|nr:hypothetical protein GSI_12415 [Ganoderma sinense ZZ0214-1]
MPKLGRTWQLGLVDDSGAVSGMHQVDVETFSARVPGPSPSASVRAKFAHPNLTDKEMSETAIGIELTRSIRSVLEAASANGLRILHTPPRKVRVGDMGEMSDAFNRVGIYLDNEAARRVTTLTDADGKKRLTREQIESGDFGRHSWYWMAVLGVVKSLRNRECAFYMQRVLSGASSDTLFEEGSDVSDDDVEVYKPSSDEEDSRGSRGSSPNDVNRGSQSYIRRTGEGEWVLDELADYMFKLSTYQHRVFGYGFYVRWRCARLLYFDRAGVLVSEPFDWTETSSPLHDFVWKLAHMTPAELGYDPTTQQASTDDIAKVSRKAMDPSLPHAVKGYVQDSFFSATKQHDLDRVPIYKLTVPASNSFTGGDSSNSEGSLLSATDQEGLQRMFLVGRPHFAADSLIGRCTRGYIAFDLATGEFCFLKDCWRSIAPRRTRPEHLVYEHLHRCDVKCIPILICGGDVGSPLQGPAGVRSYLTEASRPVPRVHYRIVTREIGLPLSDFTHFGELNRVFLGALVAHYTAWEAGILHHDVSVGNILIDPVTRRGLLIDWGNSRLKSELEEGPVQSGRSGTWRFLSALALKFPRKPYRLSDDLESFVHAYRWMVLRFHPTNLMDLRIFIKTQYEQCVRIAATGIRVGGDYKLISHNAPKPVFWVRDNDRLRHLLEDLAAGCHQHYQSIDMERMDELYGVPEPEDLAPRIPQPGPEWHTPREANPGATFSDEMMAVIKGMRSRVSRPDPSPPRPPVPSLPNKDAADPPADPCDVEGFLSAHSPLVEVFKKWEKNCVPRHRDQFLLRCQDEPIYCSDSDSSATLSQA